MQEVKAITLDEAQARGLVPYEFDHDVCFEISTVCVYRRDGIWHAYGETPDGDEVDTLWAGEGSHDLYKVVMAVLDAIG